MAFRKGITLTEYPHVTFMLGKKTLPKNNLLIGYDPAQIRLSEFILETPCVYRTSLKDEDLLGVDTPLHFRVDNAPQVELSPNLRANTGIWSAHSIEEGSAAAGALVRYAATEILGENKPDHTRVTRVAHELTREEVYDVRGAIWTAVGFLLEDMPEKKRWPEPWDNTTAWLPPGVDISYRLNSLYHTLVAYVFSKDKDQPETVKKLGIKPSRLVVYRTMSLDLGKVYASIQELSRWRNLKYSSYIAAIKLSAIWAKS
jgi:hypothetical protein